MDRAEVVISNICKQLRMTVPISFQDVFSLKIMRVGALMSKNKKMNADKHFLR